jgi:hypothetical protein
MRTRNQDAMPLADTREDDRTSLLRVHDFARNRAARGRRGRTYGDDPLPTREEALEESFAASPSWFLRVECDRCGMVQVVNQVHIEHGDMHIRDILAEMRHGECGGKARKAELLTGLEGVSSRPVRKIVLREG